jgi:hypothetical protein
VSIPCPQPMLLNSGAHCSRAAHTLRGSLGWSHVDLAAPLRQCTSSMPGSSGSSWATRHVRPTHCRRWQRCANLTVCTCVLLVVHMHAKWQSVLCLSHQMQQGLMLCSPPAPPWFHGGGWGGLYLQAQAAAPPVWGGPMWVPAALLRQTAAACHPGRTAVQWMAAAAHTLLFCVGGIAPVRVAVLSGSGQRHPFRLSALCLAPYVCSDRCCTCGRQMVYTMQVCPRPVGKHVCQTLGSRSDASQVTHQECVTRKHVLPGTACQQPGLQFMHFAVSAKAGSSALFERV